jgi:UDP-N-acetylmuramate--alanine ligase
VLKLEDIKKVYFIGIGGIGMSAIARFFNERGVAVSGYDKTSTSLTEQLVKEGIFIHFDDNTQKAPLDADLVIYTPAIPKEHTELKMYQNSKVPLMKRSEVLGIISQGSFCIAVSGSHGKTTVSAMITHVLKESGHDCSAFLGGISVNLNSNYVNGKNNVVVIEADEYDRSFHRLDPDIAIITAVDTDHLDIYGTKKNIEEAFLVFTERLKKDGSLIVQKNVSILPQLKADHLITYSLNDLAAMNHCTAYQIIDGKYHVEIENKAHEKFAYTLGVAGYHNVENSLAAISVAQLLNIPFEKVASALQTFKGIKRRFEYVFENEKMVYIDDYAHHPEEINVFLGSLKEMFPNKKICVIFQPHLFSRTKDLQDDFAKSLSSIDQLYLLDIYPAREQPMEGVSSALILDKVSIDKKEIISKERLLEKLAHDDFDVLATIGAGDIDTMIQPIKKILINKY